MTPRLPAIPNLHDHAFETIAAWFDKFIDQTRPADSHRHLQGWLVKNVRDGHMTLRRLIELTRDKSAGIDADEALRDIAQEMQQRREQPPEILQSYLICFSKPSRGKGRSQGHNLVGLYRQHTGFTANIDFPLSLKEIAKYFFHGPIDLERPRRRTPLQRIAEASTKFGGDNCQLPQGR